MPGDIAEWIERGDLFRQQLDRRKAELAPADFEWYPYDSMGGLCLLDALLTGARRQLGDLLGKGPVLDLCCGDGDLSFYLESEGCQVDAVDWPVTNHNFLKGAAALREALESQVQVSAIDLDSRFTLPGTRYAAAFFFGGLYHLKNPCYVLETLARHAEHCFLSARIARWTPDHLLDLHTHPLAYLVSAEELNADWTNYWVFSEQGLRRLIERAGWEILAWATAGDQTDSDPVAAENDERAVCLLRSRPRPQAARGEGWHEAEGSGWRWTERRFALEVAGSARTVLLDAALPEFTFARTGPLTLRAWWDETSLPALRLERPGPFRFAARLPAAARNPARLVLEVDGCVPADETDRRERGLIILNDAVFS
jgi:tRNA (mo5U34)-methyltransferase